MDYWEITVETLPGSIEAVAAALTAAGFSDLVLEDQGELESFLEENRAYWDYIDEDLQQKLQGLSQIKLYLPQSDIAAMEKLNTLLAHLRADGSLGSLPVTKAPLGQTNWEESWKENYPPQYIGDRLVVLPYWLPKEAANGRIPVILDPGLTFGTGAHPSTQMVIQAMEQLLPQGGSCLDLGSGSGILSIAALRLGAKCAIGVDIDPKAEDIARENAAYNGFSAPEFLAMTGNVMEDGELMARLRQRQYDVVLVNIVADVIIGIAPVLPKLMTMDSVLICSGILDSRLAEVQSALNKAGLAVTAVYSGEEWRCVTAKRRNV